MEVYVQVSAKEAACVRTTEAVPGTVFLDYDSRGDLVGVEVLGVLGGVRVNGREIPSDRRKDPPGGP